MVWIGAIVAPTVAATVAPTIARILGRRDDYRKRVKG
jgi:integral membrane sensor domain MASE1